MWKSQGESEGCKHKTAPARCWVMALHGKEKESLPELFISPCVFWSMSCVFTQVPAFVPTALETVTSGLCDLENKTCLCFFLIEV